VTLYSSMVSGLLTKQLADEPHVPFDEGRYMRLLPVVLEMFYARYRVQAADNQ
jgi:hypothetical protein